MLMNRKAGGARRLKGDYDFVTTPLGIVIFVAAVLALMIFVQAALIKYNAEMNIVDKQINSVDAAHIVKNCFMGADGKISASFLESKKGTRICSPDLCKCSANIGARVEYLEGGLVQGGPKKGDSFNFNYDQDGKFKHRVFITVTNGEKDYLANLSVNIYE